ncbi:hypothetical protein C8T65DRAFT_829314 [Cerioporus squamosus]|nr:hypothetical protein C8T65DRAFT_829314 [Cerioporus squamosus]
MESMESPLPPSDCSGFSWNASSRLPESVDVPQASYTMSPDKALIEEPPFGEHDDDASDGSVYSSLGGCADPMLLDETEWDGVTWDAVCLTDFLGELFEHADPWSTLSGLLDLPPFQTRLPRADPDLSELLHASDRSGVGYEATPRSPGWQDLSSQTLAQDISACTPPLSPGAEPPGDVPAVDSDPPSSGQTAYEDTPEEVTTYLPRAESFPVPAISPSPAEMHEVTVKPPRVTFGDLCSPRPTPEEDLDVRSPVLEEKYGDDGSERGDACVSTVERCASGIIEIGAPEAGDRDVSVDGPSLFADDDGVDLDEE